MAIIHRFIRLCKADIHGVMDQIEDRRLLLNQYLREMATVLDRKEARLRQMTREAEQLQATAEAVEQETARLEKDITSAIQKDRDDIARFLIKKQKPLTDRYGELKRQIRDVAREIETLRDILERQHAQYETLRVKARAYCNETHRPDWSRGMSDIFSEPETAGPDEKEVELELIRRKENLKKKEAPHEQAQ